ncbi:carbohydrate ABC transporter permease [Paenibacillus terrigena]|uniref:carbohydrate ABC transporter permease n=1 Tax=Paenibacillus terrigena TaxID=369333 RepID=UPI0028D32809|nr:carbohydrate ABC transporter permease [Paenibacillus terrigena]
MPFQWIPTNPSFENYLSAWTTGNIDAALFNSALASVIMLIFHVLLCSMTGYVIVKYNFRFKKSIITLIMATMMLPQEITYFPIYPIIQKLGLINTHLGLALPFFYSGFGVFLMMQFSRYMPNEMMESARLDGCSEPMIFFRIAVPMLKSSMAALSILAFSFMWNEFAWARIVITGDEMRTLPIVLSQMSMSSDNSKNIPSLLAASVITAAPVIIVFLMFQKQFIESVASSGLKG